MKARKGISALIALIMMISCCTFAQASDIEPMASEQIMYCSASAYTGSRSGQIDIEFNVLANGTMKTIGVSKIAIYKSNGQYVTTIYGSVSNGLLANNVSAHRDTYTYSGVSGTSYYAVVTIYAYDGKSSDTQNITTNTVRAA